MADFLVPQKPGFASLASDQLLRGRSSLYSESDAEVAIFCSAVRSDIVVLPVDMRVGPAALRVRKWNTFILANRF